MTKSLLLIFLQLVASGSDAYFTHRNLAMRGGFEGNPLARPFVKSTPAQIAWFSSGAAAQIAIPIVLEKHGHRKLGKAVAILGIASNATGAAYSATH